MGTKFTDKYEWGQICSRLALGTVTILMSALDVHAQASVITEEWTFTGSRIWMLAAHSWVLPPFAVLLVLEQVVEHVLLYLAGRAYTTPRMTGFFGGMQMQFTPFVNRGGTMRASMTPSAYERPFDPYTPYDPADGGTTMQRAATRRVRDSMKVYMYPRGESHDMETFAPLIDRR